MSNRPSQATVSETEMAGLLGDVSRQLGGRRAQELVDAVCTGLTVASDEDSIVAASNLMGMPAFVSRTPPAGWFDNLNGAIAAKVNGTWTAAVRFEGDVTVLPAEASATESQILAASEIIYFRLVPEAEAAELTYTRLQDRARQGFRHIAWQSLAINLCALTVPFFTMAVYDRVLGGGANHALWALLSGALIVLILMFVLRRVRAQLVTAEHSRFAATVSLALADRIFRQPYAYRQGLTTDQVLGRLRTGERASDIFASSNVTAIYDAPFLVLTLIAIVFVGGSMVLVPALYLLLFLVLGLYVGGIGRGIDPEARKLSRERQLRLGELTEQHRAIRQRGLSKSWLKRFDQVTRSVARDTFQSQRRSGALQSISYVLGTGAALLTLIVGLERVLVGQFSAGALMGIMLLTWRVTGPAQALFLALPRLVSMRSGWTQLKPLLATPTVAQQVHAQDAFGGGKIDLVAQGLYYRYPTGAVAAVAGVSFEIPAGSFVVVLGPNGAGKSTLLRLLAGVLTSQSGALLVNGRSVGQFDPDDYSNKVHYQSSGVVENQSGSDPISNGRDTALYLLDDPDALDADAGHAALRSLFESQTGKATVIVATHDTALAEIADLAIVLDRGSLAYFGPVNKPDAATSPAEISEEPN